MFPKYWNDNNLMIWVYVASGEFTFWIARLNFWINGSIIALPTDSLIIVVFNSSTTFSTTLHKSNFKTISDSWRLNQLSNRLFKSYLEIFLPFCLTEASYILPTHPTQYNTKYFHLIKALSRKLFNISLKC